LKLKKSVYIVDDPETIRLFADFTHSKMLQLLSEHPMTEAQLSAELGITRAAIGYHLNPLKKAGLIYLYKVEAEEHGILQKFYSPIAAVIVANYDNIPKDVKRNFIQIQIEHLRGIFTALQLQHRFSGISPENLEKLAVAMLKQLEKTCRDYKGVKVVKNAENLKIKIYAEALASLTKLDEWNALIN
jgi:DNA-binding transcriptional ArsR family regulator